MRRPNMDLLGRRLALSRGTSPLRGPCPTVTRALMWNRVGPSAKIPPSRRKINDTVLQLTTWRLEVAWGQLGAEAPDLATAPAVVNRASLA